MDTNLVSFSPITKKKTAPPLLSGGQKNHCHQNQPKIKQKVVVSTDWIEFTCMAKSALLICQDDRFTTEAMETGSPYFRERFVIKYNNFPIAMMECKPRPSYLDPNLIKIKLENYCNYCFDVHTLVKDIVCAFEFSFKNFTRMDYSIDFQESDTEGSINDFLEDVSAGKIRMKGKSLVIHRASNSDITGVSFGKRASGLMCTIYNKTTHMRQRVDKPYIRETWQAAGFDQEESVYRMEFSCGRPRTENISEDFETLGTFHSIDLLSNINEYVNYLINSNLFYYTDKRVSRQSGFKLVMKESISKFKRIYPVIKQAATNIKKSMLKHLTLEALFMQKDGKKRAEASAAWELIQSIMSRWGLSEWGRKTFPRLNINTSQFSMLDELTTRELKDFRFSSGNFRNGSLEF